jgi:hypothetical protein
MRRSKIGIASLTAAARDQKTLIWLFRCWRSFPPQEIESRARGFERGDGNCNRPAKPGFCLGSTITGGRLLALETCQVSELFTDLPRTGRSQSL